MTVFQQQDLFAFKITGIYLSQLGLRVVCRYREDEILIKQGHLFHIFLAQGQGKQGGVQISMFEHARNVGGLSFGQLNLQVGKCLPQGS